jgi:hypothetical protein
MTRLLTVVVTAVPLLLILASPLQALDGGPRAKAQLRTGARIEIEAQHSRQIAAYKRKDLKGFMEPLASDYRLKKWDGEVMDRKQTEEMVRQRMAGRTVVDNLAVNIDTINVNGNEATVMTSQNFARLVTDTKGVQHHVVSNTVHRETWVKTPQGWKVRLVEEMEPKVKVDGKSVPNLISKKQRSAQTDIPCVATVTCRPTDTGRLASL